MSAIQLQLPFVPEMTPKFRHLPMDTVFEILSFDKNVVIRHGKAMFQIPKDDPRRQIIDNSLFYDFSKGKPAYSHYRHTYHTNNTFYDYKTNFTYRRNYNDSFRRNHYYKYAITNDISFLLDDFVLLEDNPKDTVIEAIDQGFDFEKKIAEKKRDFPELWRKLIKFAKDHYLFEGHDETETIEKFVSCIMNKVIYYEYDNGIYTVIEIIRYDKMFLF